MVGGLMVGAAPVIHDGSPTWPDVDGAWRVAELTRADVIGCGAGYLMAGSNAGSSPKDILDLSRIRGILQTGSTLPDHAWIWTSEHVSATAPAQLDLRRHRRLLGAGRRQPAAAGARRADPGGRARRRAGGLGPGRQAGDRAGGRAGRHQAAALDAALLPQRPGRPRATTTATSTSSPASGGTATGSPSHSDRSISISGRSDSTLNRMGVRMGSAEIYAVVEQLPEVADSLVIGVERPDGSYLMPLFVVPAEGHRRRRRAAGPDPDGAARASSRRGTCRTRSSAWPRCRAR